MPLRSACGTTGPKIVQVVTSVLMLSPVGALCVSCDVAGTARSVSHSLSGQDFNTFVTRCGTRRAFIFSHLSITATRWIALPSQNHRATCGSTFREFGIAGIIRKISRCCLFGLAQGRACCSSRVGIRTMQNIRSKATSASSQLLGVRTTLRTRTGFPMCLFFYNFFALSVM